MRRRTITVTLTEAQYSTLGSAVATATEEWTTMADDDPAPGGGYFGREVEVLDRAWSKINEAWYARERRTR